MLLIASICVGAASADVVLTTTQTYSTSAAIGLNPSADYDASNSASSARSVYAIVYKSLPGQSFVRAGESLMDIGQGCSGSYIDGGNCSWKLQLNPTWASAGCSASGSIYY